VRCRTGTARSGRKAPSGGSGGGLGAEDGRCRVGGRIRPARGSAGRAGPRAGAPGRRCAGRRRWPRRAHAARRGPDRPRPADRRRRPRRAPRSPGRARCRAHAPRAAPPGRSGRPQEGRTWASSQRPRSRSSSAEDRAACRTQDAAASKPVPRCPSRSPSTAYLPCSSSRDRSAACCSSKQQDAGADRVGEAGGDVHGVAWVDRQLVQGREHRLAVLVAHPVG